MKGFLKREDDFAERRKKIAELSDEELKARFWSDIEKIVDPLLDLARTHTSPSIERSVLLRMGFSSLEAKPLVEGAIDRGLIGHGVGHVVYRIAREKQLDLRQAGLEMIEGDHWDDALKIFKGGDR
ncbi:MAG: ornithine aminomutase [delta proteobacterium ML8_F1]|nr:MAG: ornithine aminomutase [delta proteobacterium ML8_F1]